MILVTALSENLVMSSFFASVHQQYNILRHRPNWENPGEMSQFGDATYGKAQW